MSTRVVPLKLARLVSLFLAFAFGTIGGSVGLNGLIKSNQSKSTLRKVLPAGITVAIGINDVYHSGVVLTTVCTLIAVLSTLFILLTLWSSTQRAASASGKPDLATRTLPLQSIVLGFCSVWLFATIIPFTDFFANRAANIAAFLNGVQLPPAAVSAAQQSLGATSVYHKLYYLRLVAVLPWFTFLFSSIAAVVLFLAARRSRTLTEERQPATDVSEKQQIETEA